MKSHPQIRGQRLIDDKPWVRVKKVTSKETVKIVDLFAGIGGFHYGIAAAASKLNKGVEPILVSELDPECQTVYEDNHDCEVKGDINRISLKGKSDQADIVTAGFPCQPFSNSGLKLGLSDPRGQFYFKIVEIIKKYQARSFILENVAGIRTNGGGSYDSELAITPQKIGKSMHVLEQNLKKLKNYHIQWLEIDSSDFGSPQVRKRVYIVGVKKTDNSEPFQLKLNEYKFKPKSFIDVVEDEFIDSLRLSENQEKNIRDFMKKKQPSFHDGMRRVGQAYTCPGGNVGQAYHAYGMVPTLTKVWARFMPIYFPNKETENYLDVVSPDFLANENYGDGHIRRASVQEVMRLQGFPDTFVPHRKDSIAYQHAGNAVNAKVVRVIAECIFDYLKL